MIQFLIDDSKKVSFFTPKKKQESLEERKAVSRNWRNNLLDEVTKEGGN